MTLNQQQKEIFKCNTPLNSIEAVTKNYLYELM